MSRFSQRADRGWVSSRIDPIARAELANHVERDSPPFGCAAILIIAATLKTHELVTNPALGVLYGSRWPHAGLIEYECILAGWLLSGFRPAWCRGVSLVSFAGFCCYSLYLALSGTASCGCFGQVRVNPSLTFTLDAGLLVLLWRWRPSLGGASWGFGAGPARPARTASSLQIATGLAIMGARC